MLQSLLLQGSSSAKMTKYQYILSILLLAISPELSDGAPNGRPIPVAAGDALSTYDCNESPAWSGPSFNPKDCAAAISQFYSHELLVHRNMGFEFLAIGAHPRSRYPSQNTPRKFTHGEHTRE